MIKLKGLLEVNENYKIYCDMDGVLCNFDKQYTDLTGMPPKEAQAKLGSKKFWEPIDKAGYKFWSEMEWMPGGKELWDYIKQFNPSILSTPSSQYSSRLGKTKWIEKNLPGFDKNKVNFSFHKYKFATPNSILIDDFKKNIIPWREAGGIGILHTHTPTSIAELKNILSK